MLKKGVQKVKKDMRKQVTSPFEQFLNPSLREIKKQASLVHPCSCHLLLSPMFKGIILSIMLQFLLTFLYLQDDRYFLSGSLDGKLRLWNIPDKRVALWNEIDGPTKLITAANFIQNGRFSVIGTYDGRCIFYDTEVSHV